MILAFGRTPFAADPWRAVKERRGNRPLARFLNTELSPLMGEAMGQPSKNDKSTPSHQTAHGHHEGMPGHAGHEMGGQGAYEGHSADARGRKVDPAHGTIGQAAGGHGVSAHAHAQMGDMGHAGHAGPGPEAGEAMGGHEGHGSHVGVGEHAHMIADFRRRFWVCLTLTIPVLALSPFIQWVFRFRLAFAGDRFVLFALAAAVYFYVLRSFLIGLG